MEEDLTIRTLTACHEENQVMTGSKGRDVRHAIGHLSADSIKTLELSIRGDMTLDVVYYLMKLIQTLCCLGVEINVMGEV